MSARQWGSGEGGTAVRKDGTRHLCLVRVCPERQIYFHNSSQGHKFPLIHFALHFHISLIKMSLKWPSNLKVFTTLDTDIMTRQISKIS